MTEFVPLINANADIFALPLMFDELSIMSLKLSTHFAPYIIKQSFASCFHSFVTYYFG